MTDKKALKRLLIDPRGGIAGDIFTAALISAGADSGKIKSAMELAGNRLGRIQVEAVSLDDGSTRMKLDLECHHDHMDANRAKKILTEVFDELEISDYYRRFGMKIIDNLIWAEKKAHSEHDFLTDHHHTHHHDHGDSGHHHDGHHHHHHHHDHGDHHDHKDDHEHHNAHKHHGEQTTLHEAQDIVIDITGAVVGMSDLGLSTEAVMMRPVSVGGGRVTFSHGDLPVPAPATKNLLERFEVPWDMGPIDVEICTPTGASILTAFDYTDTSRPSAAEADRIGRARGSKTLDIPPFTIYINE